MNKSKRKLIAQFADKLNEDGTISESLYGIRVQKGREAIDQFISAIESNYLDWDWNDKQFQKLLSQTYKGKPPASPEQLAAELQKSVQEDALKQKLVAQLGSASRVAAKQAPAPAAPAAPAQAKAPAAPAAGKQPINLAHGQTYEVTYQNFQGKTLIFKDLIFWHQVGAHATFKMKRPANRRMGNWSRGRRTLTPQQAQQKIQLWQQAIANLPNATYRAHGGKLHLTLAQMPKSWVKMRQHAELRIKSSTQYYQALIQSVHNRLKEQSMIRIGLMASRILSAK